jgi:hypothetical protein
MITIEHLQSLAPTGAIDATLAKITNEQQLGKFIRAYADWNSTFASGVTALTSLIGQSVELFADPSRPIAVRDRSVLIASHVFDAARDEYDDGAQSHRDPHRSLAQATLIALSNITDNQEILETPTQPWLKAYRNYVIDGYSGAGGFGQRRVFAGMGYHLGSELLADQEFSKIDAMMRERFNPIVQQLMRTTVPLHGTSHRCYAWIGVHSGAGGGVEMDHFEAGLSAANLALKYLNTEMLSQEAAKIQLEASFERFADEQSFFFEAIGGEL